jgi:hypothetical protein
MFVKVNVGFIDDPGVEFCVSVLIFYCFGPAYLFSYPATCIFSPFYGLVCHVRRRVCYPTSRPILLLLLGGPCKALGLV